MKITRRQLRRLINEDVYIVGSSENVYVVDSLEDIHNLNKSSREDDSYDFQNKTEFDRWDKEFDIVDKTLAKGYSKEIGDLVPGGMSQDLANLPLRKALEEISKMHNIDNKMLLEEFEIGVSEEMEHTNSILIATEIALDHLVEHPDYYTRLEAAGL